MSNTFYKFIALATLLLLVGCPDETTDPEPMPSGELEDLAEGRWLLHVNARSSSDIYVVGGTPDDGFLSRYDGNSWQSAELDDEIGLLNWIHLFDDGSAVAVGNGGSIVTSEDGETWTSTEPITEEDLWGVWGSAPDDIWAVGGRGRSESVATVLRYQNGEWAAVDTPELERPGVRAFFKVWGSSADHVFIVGQNGAGLRWDGNELIEFGVGTSEDLIALDGTGPDNVVVVGGRGNGVIARWDGESWTSESVSPAPGLNGVWLTAPDRGWVAGVNGTLRQLTIEDGSFTVERTPPKADVDLHAVAVIDGFGILAVGGNFALPQGPYEGAIVLEQP